MWLAQKRGAHRPHRTLPALLALALLLVTLPHVLGGAASSPVVVSSGSGHNGGPGSWAPAGSMAWGPGPALLLPDGKVFVLGSLGGSSGAQLYDPATGQWSVTCGMTTTDGATATILPDGKVFVAGGATAYDTPSPCLASGAASHTAGDASTAQAARSGRALPGGAIRRKTPTWHGSRPRTAPHNPPPPPVPRCRAEVYESRSNTWALTSPMATCRFGHTATLLPTGRVLVAGGDSSCDDSGCKATSNAELYDPHTGQWSSTGSMTKGRDLHTALLLRTGRVLVVGLDGSAELYDPHRGRWVATASMTTPHPEGAVTLLPNGQVLVAGGSNGGGPISSTELYDPRTGRWTPTGSMNVAREHFTVTLLQSGLVLAAGGCCALTPGSLASAEVYDPRSGAWTMTGSMDVGRSGHVAVLLHGGRVLVAGGGSGTRVSAELYTPGPAPRLNLTPRSPDFGVLPVRTPSDTRALTITNIGTAPVTIGTIRLAGPNNADFSVKNACSGKTLGPAGTCALAARFVPGATGARATGLMLTDRSFGVAETLAFSMTGYGGAPNTWVPAGVMNTGRFYHTATLLPSGNVLVAGGISGCCGSAEYGAVLSSAEVYDPRTGRWTTTGSMRAARKLHAATLLPNGMALVVGGEDYGDRGLSSAELYNPKKGTWTLTGGMHEARADATVTLLTNGKVLVAGGFENGATLASAELYDPRTGAWTATGSMGAARQDHTATLLPDGRVLVAGGDSGDNSSGFLSSAELYDPRSGQWMATGAMPTAHAVATATLLPDGKVLVVGGRGASSYLTRAEIYNPATGAWSRTASLHEARALHTATLLRDGRVLVAGGEVQQTTHRSSAELYDPRTGTWTVTGSLAMARDTHTATLLSSGQVLVAGGCCASTGNGGTLDVAELYQTAP